MEDILGRLLVADNAVIQQATIELKAALKNPSSLGCLCSIITTSKNPQIRQYAAIVLRQRIKKSRNWCHLDEALRNQLTNDILESLKIEQEQFVLKAIVQLTASIAKHDLPSNHWRQLLEFLGRLCSLDSTEAMAHKVHGFFILSILSEDCPDIFSPVLPNIGSIVVETFQSVPDAKSPLVTHSLATLKNLAEHFSEDQSIKSCYTVIMPHMLKLFKTLSENDSDVACDLLDMLDDLLEYSIINTMQQINPIVNVCLQLAVSSDEQIQFKALCVIDTIIKMRKKAIIKSDLLAPILQALVEVMQMPCDEDLDYDNANELNSPVIFASQVLDGIALTLPPGKIMPYILESVQILTTQDPNPNKMKAAYVIMAVTSEGCAEYICNKCFNIYFELLCKGLEEPVLQVRNSALYALGQFLEHLQPEMSKHSEQLMPILFKFLDHIMSNLHNEEKTHVDRVFYALETFIEHSEKETFLPFLSPLLGNLLSLVTAESKTHLKQLALSVIGASATTAEDSISPYLRQIVDCLSWLMSSLPRELLNLQIQAIETMATLARAVSPENFQQVAHDCIQYGYSILENQTDPELEGSIYGLFGAASAVLKQDISDKMGPVIASILKTLESSEGIVLHYDEESLLGCGDLSDSADEIDLEATSDDDDDDDEVTGFSVENVYLEKKAAACYAIKDLAMNTGFAFTPYLSKCSNAILKLLEYPNGIMKKAALDALSQLCVNCMNIQNAKASADGVSVFIQKCAEIVHTDEDKEVVAQALESYAYLLKSSKNLVLKRTEHREAIFNCVLDVFHKRTLCQLDEEDAITEEDENAEQDELLIEYAGDVLPYFGRAMPSDEFKGYFITIFPCLKSKLKPSGTVAERSFGIGILAECMEPLAPILHEFSNEILPEFVAGVRDEHCDIRNNAVYGLGEMLYHGKDKFFLHYGEVLQLFSQCLAQETVPKVIDNICGAVGRMVVTNTTLVPLDQVFPVIMTCIPLKKDYKENSIIMKCFLHLYEGGHDIVAQHLDKILHTVIHIIHHKQGEEDALMLAEQIFTMILRDFPDRISGLRIVDELLPTYAKLVNK